MSSMWLFQNPPNTWPLEKGGNEVDPGRIPCSHAHSRAFLGFSRRCYLITWGWKPRMCDLGAKVSDNHMGLRLL
uniref:Uncharacterized protein n=1 Tax=Catagonus wagneri TaxID=51154 RepID=A0A8C3X2W9_9CETA